MEEDINPDLFQKANGSTPIHLLMMRPHEESPVENLSQVEMLARKMLSHVAHQKYGIKIGRR